MKPPSLNNANKIATRKKKGKNSNMEMAIHTKNTHKRLKSHAIPVFTKYSDHCSQSFNELLLMHTQDPQIKFRKKTQHNQSRSIHKITQEFPTPPSLNNTPTNAK